MKVILFTSRGKAELVEQEVRRPEKNEVTVKLMVTTISPGTERANILDLPNTFAYGRWPKQEGYSSAGIVTEVGSEVQKFKPGDRVAVSWSHHQEYMTLPENNLVKLDDDVSFSEGALYHITTFPLAAIRKCRLEIGESALVMGQGVLGQLAILLLKAAGAVPVIAVDPVPEKRQRAMEVFGADAAFDPFAADFVDRVKSLTHGGANVVIEVTGVGAGLQGALDVTAEFGRVALLGCTRFSDFNIDYYTKVHKPGITLVGAHTNARPKVDSSQGWWTERDDIRAIMKLSRFGRIRLDSFVEETFSPADAPAVYERLSENPAFPLAQFDWTRLS